MLGVADIVEALTAKEEPHEPCKTLVDIRSLPEMERPEPAAT